MEVEVQVQKLSPKAIQVAEGLMGKLTEVERRYMEDFILGLSARQSAIKHGVKTHTVYVVRSTLRRKLEILMSRSEIYIRLPKPAATHWIKTSSVAKRMGITIDQLQWLVTREAAREGGSALPLPEKVNDRYRWTAGQAAAWLEYVRCQKLSTAEVANLLSQVSQDWSVTRLHSILERRKELYADHYNEWHTDEVLRLIDALAAASLLAPDEAQAAKAKLEERKEESCAPPPKESGT